MGFGKPVGMLSNMARNLSKSAGSERYPPTSSAKTVDKEESRAPAEKPVSLHPLGFEEVVKNLLRVKGPRGKLGRNDGETND